ncbi:MAG TPA: GNAT family N-acetyltransferase [Solirubrobacteraceae bacterium]|jgi:GNAT superfamily N-acetyltransferase
MSTPDSDVEARARAWRHGAHAAVCDVIEPWAHGTVVRSTRHPTYYEFNLVRVEEDPAMSLEALVDVADEALAGLEHRRFDFEVVGVADALRPGFEALGWKTMRLVWMRHEFPPPPGPDVAVREVPYDAVHDLRLVWHGEDFPNESAIAFFEHAREVAMSRDVRILAVHDGHRPIAFAQLERAGDSAEITQVFVHPDYRGAGRGTAMTRAAIEAAGDVRDLWIAADDEDRPKELYARLGFRPAGNAMEVTRWP